VIVVDVSRGDPLPEPVPFGIEQDVVDGARRIIEQVRAGGDEALVELTALYDRADIREGIAVPKERWKEATERLAPEIRTSLDRMAGRLRDLHERQVPRPWVERGSGMAFGEVVRPLGSVGCYVPGGRAAYPSSVLMTVVPAKVAGVPRVVVCTPPDEEGAVPRAVLHAASVAGADAVFRVGGAQAVAALAFGTETVPLVDKVVGPGNMWVTAAKRELAGVVGIDGLAGPTELVIVADAAADPAMLAVDLVAQAEHDPGARTTLVTLDASTGHALPALIGREATASPRRGIVERSIEQGRLVLVPDLASAARVVDALAPEHLQLVVAEPRAFLERVRSFGAAFLGPMTPVSFGDYGVGSNHVLPTMGTARFASGLRAPDFVTVSSFVEASEEGIRAFGDEVEAIATAEGLPGHAMASRARRRRRVDS
jgi:histidinol dehydrogenase